jgi:hypothetical protein
VTLPGEESEARKRIIELRPMDVGDILDGTIRIYRAAPWTLIGIWAVLVGLPVAVQAAAGSWLQELMLSIDPESPTFSSDLMEMYGTPDFWTPLGIAVISVIFWFFTARLANGSVVWAVSELILGRQPGIMESIRTVWPKFARILIASIFIYGIAIVLTLLSLIPLLGILFFFLLIYTLIHVLFATQAVVIDDFQPWNALHRSGNLIKGRALKTSSTYFLVLIMILVISYGLQGGLSLIDYFLRMIPGLPIALIIGFSGLLMTLANIIIQPFAAIALTLLYYDLRVRKEGFDMVVLADEIAGLPAGQRYRVPYSASDNKWF